MVTAILNKRGVTVQSQYVANFDITRTAGTPFTLRLAIPTVLPVTAFHKSCYLGVGDHLWDLATATLNDCISNLAMCCTTPEVPPPTRKDDDGYSTGFSDLRILILYIYTIDPPAVAGNWTGTIGGGS